MSGDSATQGQHKGGKKTPSTLGVVPVASIVYPVLHYYLVHLLSIEDPATRYVLNILTSVFLGALALWALKREGIPLDGIGFGLQGLRRSCSSQPSGSLWELLYYALAGEAVLDHVSPMLILTQQWILLGIAEELLFRGYLLSRLARTFGAISDPKAQFAAVIVSSLVFSLWHIPVRVFQGASLPDMMLSLAPVFALGVYLGPVYVRSGNVVCTGFAHGS